MWWALLWSINYYCKHTASLNFVEFPRRRSRRQPVTPTSIFFRAAAVALAVQFFDSEIFLRSPKSENERLVSWCRKKMMKAGAIGRLGDVTRLLQSSNTANWQSVTYAEFCLRGVVFLPRSPREICEISHVAIAVGKKCDASTSQSNNYGVSRKRFKPSTPGSVIFNFIHQTRWHHINKTSN